MHTLSLATILLIYMQCNSIKHTLTFSPVEIKEYVLITRRNDIASSNASYTVGSVCITSKETIQVTPQDSLTEEIRNAQLLVIKVSLPN